MAAIQKWNLRKSRRRCSVLMYSSLRTVSSLSSLNSAMPTLRSRVAFSKEKFNREVAKMAGPVSTSGGGAGVWGELVVGRSVGG